MNPAPSPPVGDDPPALPAGTVVGPFTLRGVLARDEFGIRYRAISAGFAGEVVIEEYALADLSVRDAAGQLVPKSAADAELWDIGLQAFLQEAHLLGKALHPALVRFAGAWHLGAGAFRQWPALAGGTLADARSHWTEPPTEYALRSLIAPLLDAIEALHRAGRLHGHVHPGQIWIQPDGAPLLLDTAAVRRAIGTRLAHPTPWPGLGFRAPELADTVGLAAPGPWSDIYSLAAVVRFCMGAPQATDDGLRQPGAPTIGRYAGYFVATFERALAVDPRMRPQSADMLRRELSSAGSPRADRDPLAGFSLSDIPLRAVPLQDAGMPIRPPAAVDDEVLRAEPGQRPVPALTSRSRRWPWVAATAVASLSIASWLPSQRQEGPASRPVAPSIESAASAPWDAADVTRAPEPVAASLPAPPLSEAAALAPGPMPDAEEPAVAASSGPDVVRPAARAVIVTTPAAACAPRSNFALYRCMQRQCVSARFRGHAQCVQLRQDNESPT